ncbi:Pyridoxal 5'-phosphate synthase subunit PDX1.2 [Spatholobus suberectus]|nr:Pyridoxal 5'-phosphate synthase subunit PDX1.2 [Spatholobus suberectus]
MDSTLTARRTSSNRVRTQLSTITSIVVVPPRLSPLRLLPPYHSLNFNLVNEPVGPIQTLCRGAIVHVWKLQQAQIAEEALVCIITVTDPPYLNISYMTNPSIVKDIKRYISILILSYICIIHFMEKAYTRSHRRALHRQEQGSCNGKQLELRQQEQLSMPIYVWGTKPQ